MVSYHTLFARIDRELARASVLAVRHERRVRLSTDTRDRVVAGALHRDTLAVMDRLEALDAYLLRRQMRRLQRAGA